jgi:hypothetical protein
MIGMSEHHIRAQSRAGRAVEDCAYGRRWGPGSRRSPSPMIREHVFSEAFDGVVITPKSSLYNPAILSR